ncbi:MAG TPA: copper transporter [Chthonomonadaceae bacterium]|nr:copper transporter [Chthonomonadaceae bacterium]
MGPGFKYHVATISAIFFALSIGLVVGSLYMSPGVASRQTNAIERLKKTLVEQNTTLNQQLSRDEQFIRDITPMFLKDKLAGEPIAIVQTGDYPDATSEARQALDLAGAHILSVTTIHRARPDEVLNAQLSELHAQDPRFPTNRQGLVNAVAGVLAHGDAPGNPLMPALEEKDFLAKSPDSDYTTGARYVVIVAGSSDAASNLHVADVDQPLITALQNRGVTVIACEEQNVQVPDIPTYNALNLNLKIVDDVESDIGHCTLVMALREAREETGGKPASADLSLPLQLGQDAGPQK